MMARGCCICFSDGLRYIVKNLNEWHVEACISVPLLFENIHGKIKAGIAESGKQGLIDFMIPISNFLRKFKIDLRRVLFSSIIKKLGGHLRLIVIGGAGIAKKDLASIFSNLLQNALEASGDAPEGNRFAEFRAVFDEAGRQ